MKTVESSAVVAFRALVMLACLIFVPLAAIFGSVCPEIVRSTLIEPILGAKTHPPGSQPALEVVVPAGVSGLFGSAGKERVQPHADAGVAPAWPGVAAPAEQAAWKSPADGRGAADAEPLVHVAIPTNYATPADAATNLNRLNSPADGAPTSGYAGAKAAAIQGGLAAASARPAHTEGPPAGGQDRFNMLERRLREYGAIYYLLETWGNEGELYRFHCKMAIGNNPNYTRHFEATHRDALQAMTQVLEQIEQWRSGRPQ